MKIAYFDCFAGISGDMCLGALVHAGVPLQSLKEELRKLPLGPFDLTAAQVTRAGISALKVDVVFDPQGLQPKRWGDIKELVERSSLSDSIKEKGLSLFKRIFEAEAKVHGEPFEKVHLHELGAIDSLVDIFGTVIGLAMFGVEKAYTSPINLGSGTIQIAHGTLPVPAPATAELLKGYPVYTSSVPFELTTPTGATIISGFESAQTPLPEMAISSIGYGAGHKEIPGMPNTLRLIIGETKGVAPHETVTVIETTIDDMNPQFYDEVIEKLFSTGALDVFMEQIIMKKGRPAIKLTALAEEKDVIALTDILFRETTTIGVRFYHAQRRTLEREIKKVETRFGALRIKVARLHGEVVTTTPEYEDLKALAKKTGLPLRKLSEEILRDVKSAIE